MSLIDTRLTRQHITRETEKAICFAVDLVRRHPSHGFSHITSIWLPKSQIVWTNTSNPCFGDSAHIPHWLARKSFG